MKKLLFYLLVFLSISSYAQNLSGEVSYEVSINYAEADLFSKGLSQEEFEREKALLKNSYINKSKYILVFNDSHALYTQDENAGSSVSWYISESWGRRDLGNKKIQDLTRFGSKQYLIEDDFYSYEWKINSDVKEVAGQLCMSASTKDPIRNVAIEVWFNPDIAVELGPDRFMGLPGLILEVSMYNGAVTYTATSVKTNTAVTIPALPKKIKAKKINKKQYDDMLLKQMEDNRKLGISHFYNIPY